MGYIIKRILQLIPIALGVTFFTFCLIYISPGDPAMIKLSAEGVPPSKEILEKTREEMGLKKPFLLQYTLWLQNICKGDFGKSYHTDRPVLDEIRKCLPKTIILAAASFLVLLVIALPLGILSAVFNDRYPDYIIRFISFISASIPNFWLALLLLYFLGLKLKLFPIMGTGSIKHIVLPTLTLGFSMSGKYIRQIRAAILEEIDRDYVIGARTRGLSEGIIMIFHVLRNSMLPIVTLFGLSIGGLLGGTCIVEKMFVWPGIGKLAIDSILLRDIPMIQGYAIWMAITFTMVNLLVDISYGIIDPHIRLQKRR